MTTFSSSDEILSPIKMSGIEVSVPERKRKHELGDVTRIEVTDKRSASYGVSLESDSKHNGRRNTVHLPNSSQTPQRNRPTILSFTSPRRSRTRMLETLSSKSSIEGPQAKPSPIGDFLTTPMSQRLKAIENILKSSPLKDSPNRLGKTMSSIAQGSNGENKRSSPYRAPVSKAEEKNSSKLLAGIDDARDIYSEFLASVLSEHAERVKSMQEAISKKNLEIDELSRSNQALLYKLTQKEEAEMMASHQIETLSQDRRAVFLELQDNIDALQKVEQERQKLVSVSEANVQALQLELTRLHTERRIQVQTFEQELTSMKEDLAKKADEIKELSNSEKAFKLLHEESKRAADSFKAQLDASLSEGNALIKERDEISMQSEKQRKEITSQRSLLEERERELREIDAKFENLVHETKELHDEMAIFEETHRSIEKELKESLDTNSQLKESISGLHIALRTKETQIEELEAEMKGLTDTIQSLRTISNEQSQRLTLLEIQNQEKDAIISGDTKKMGQLVQDVNTLKDALAAKKSTVSDKDSLAQISELKMQINAAQKKTDERIQEVAEQLYHQYSKKHEAKVSQLKRNYEAKLEERSRVMSESERQIQSLENKLLAEMKEKSYLLSLIEKGDVLK